VRLGAPSSRVVSFSSMVNPVNRLATAAPCSPRPPRASEALVGQPQPLEGSLFVCPDASSQSEVVVVPVVVERSDAPRPSDMNERANERACVRACVVFLTSRCVDYFQICVQKQLKLDIECLYVES
jgi:hypothetical protein